MRSKKILLIHNIISPTRTQLFNKLYEKFNKEGNYFKVFFISEIEGNRLWNTSEEKKKFKFPYKILKSTQIVSKFKSDKYFFHINNNIIKEIKKENPDIIIHAGWASLSAFQTCLWAKKNNKKFVLRSGSTIYEKSLRRIITKPLVRWLVKNSDYFLSYGTRATEYLQYLGANGNKIYKLYNTVDVDYFISQYNLLKGKKSILKKELNISNKYILLFVGQLIKRKGVYELLEAYLKLKEQLNLDVGLLFVGSGIEENALKTIVKQKSINSVYFVGYKQKKEIAKYFFIADIFVLPSYEEVWGLVINEAMCFNLPILTTKYVGASADLVKNGKNGVIINNVNSFDIFQGLKFILDNGLIKDNESLEIIKKFTIDNIICNLNL